MNIAGNVGDALGAEWSFNAETDVPSLRVHGELTSRHVRVGTRDLVERSLVPAEVADAIRAELPGAVAR